MLTLDDRQHALKLGGVLVEAVAAGVEPLEFCCKVVKKILFVFLTRDPGALLSIIAKQQRHQAVTEANDDERRPNGRTA